MAPLHILNGDAIRNAFIRQPIPQSEIVLWREVLAQGPVTSSIGESQFWTQRADFFEQFFDVNQVEYARKVKAEFLKLRAISAPTPITLWFEYDWFCQINLISLLAYFASQPDPLPQLSLVCIGTVPDYDRLVGLGEIDPDLFPQLFAERQLLPRAALAIASQFWSAYTEGRPEELLPIARAGRSYFPYLETATSAHLLLYPDAEHGLNVIQYQLLSFIASGLTEKEKVIGAMLRWDEYYGFGDLQYEKYLSDLQALLEVGKALKLNAVGTAVLNGKQRLPDSHAPVYHYGGGSSQQFRWNSKLNQITRL